MSIGRNTNYNLVGAAIPIVLALVTVPLYLRLIGDDRYGVLSIAWLFLGYFGLFDLGLGRATTYHISALRDGSSAERADVFWSAIMVNIVMGLVGAAILWPSAGYFFAHVFKVDEALRPEIMASVPLLAASVPIATMTGVLTGTLMGRDRFLEVNILSVTSTALFQIFPLTVAWLIGPDIWGLLAAALAARAVAILFMWVRCHQLVLRGERMRFDTRRARELLAYGGWVTLTAIFGPALVIVDRFAIGAILGATAVTVYTVPFQLAQRIAILPNALVSAIFPRLPTAAPEEQARISSTALLSLLSVLGPPIMVALFLLHPFLDLWIGPKLGAPAAAVGGIIILGFWINAFAVIPYSRLQGTGRPDLVTKLLLAQIPVYLVALYFGMKQFGLIGCAVVFTIRCAADFILMSIAAAGRLENQRLIVANAALLTVGVFATALLSYHQPAWWVAAVVLTAAISLLGWRTMPAELHARIAALRRFVPGSAV
ncbi:flippase [Sphingomonas flavalba]|uniref:flippase n=1 Tax=Sphingomonas flavalba TaxID=2559804 RepID=UPI0039DFE32E